MQIQVVLNNFQQTEHADLTFTEGLSIIQGLNNNGKSSLLRAINAVVFNNARKTKNYIQKGKKSCSVLIRVEGYKDILWTKTSKEVTYQIGDDEPLEKAGRLTLKDVYPDHPFVLYDNTLLFNVINQKAKPIPFGQTSSQIFSIFEELYGILSTKEDIEKFQAQTSQYNSKLCANRNQLESLQQKQISFKNFKNSVNVGKLEALKSKLKSLQSKIDMIESVKNLKNLTESYQKSEVPINPDDLKDIISTLKLIKDIKSKHESLDNKIIVPIPVDTNLFKDYEKLKTIVDLDTKLKSLAIDRENTQDIIKELKSSLPVCPTCKRPF